MPLRRECSLEAFSKNIETEIKSGKPRPQSVAIAYSVLKKACGVKSKKKMTPKEIISMGRKSESIKRSDILKDYLDEIKED